MTSGVHTASEATEYNQTKWREAAARLACRFHAAWHSAASSTAHSELKGTETPRLNVPGAMVHGGNRAVQ
jgi:hypothetical protein